MRWGPRAALAALLGVNACVAAPLERAGPAPIATARSDPVAIGVPPASVATRDPPRQAPGAPGAHAAPREPAGPPATLAEFTDRLRAAAPSAGFLRAELTPSGECAPVAAFGRNTPLPVASVFKLYVLGAVVAAVQAGALAWGQEVTLRDALDSLPSGNTQDEPAGSTLSVRELSRRMILLSDNTATDHLIDLVGRAAVEAAVVDMGHTDPGLLRPLLTTREWFVLRADPELLARYVAADEGGRRDLLAGTVAHAPLPTRAALRSQPRSTSAVGWLASPTDVCAAMAAVADMAATPGLEIVNAIMSTNPSPNFDPGTFRVVFHKSGREPGVLFDAWLAVRPDGTRCVMVGGVVDEHADIDPELTELIAHGLMLSQRSTGLVPM